MRINRIDVKVTYYSLINLSNYIICIQGTLGQARALGLAAAREQRYLAYNYIIYSTNFRKRTEISTLYARYLCSRYALGLKAAARPSARATIGYLVYKFQPRLPLTFCIAFLHVHKGYTGLGRKKKIINGYFWRKIWMQDTFARARTQPLGQARARR